MKIQFRDTGTCRFSNIYEQLNMILFASNLYTVLRNKHRRQVDKTTQNAKTDKRQVKN